MLKLISYTHPGPNQDYGSCLIRENVSVGEWLRWMADGGLYVVILNVENVSFKTFEELKGFGYGDDTEAVIDYINECMRQECSETAK